MTLVSIFVICSLIGGIAAISTVSKGSYFTKKVKTFITMISVLVLIGLSIYGVINYGFLYILAFIACYIGSAWISSFLWITVFYKGKY